MERRVKVRGIVVLDGKILAVKLKPYDGIFDNDYWCIPGGTVDPGEDLLKALKREFVEELGIEPEVGNLLFVQQFAHSNRDTLELFFNITNPADFLEIDLSKTTHGAEEIEEVGFYATADLNIKPDFLANEDLSQITENSPTKFFSYI